MKPLLTTCIPLSLLIVPVTALAQTEAPEVPAEAPPEEPEPLSLSAFVDAYVGLQTSRMGTPVPYHRAYATSTMINDTAVADNGFSLSFAGLDISYDTGPAAATISLRAGPSVPLFYASSTTTTFGIDNITQAYVTWRPTDSITFDLGQFGTIYGAEVAESWQNLNYTRGGLYYAMQPFWHTGLRAGFGLTDELTLTALVVDGVNTISESQDTDDTEPSGVDPIFYPSLGGQVSYSMDKLSFALGALYSPEKDADGFNLFVDALATVDLDPLTIIFNADYNMDDVKVGDSTSFYGLSLAAGLAITDMFGVAGRAEYLVDSDNALYQVPDPSAGGMALLDDAVSVTTLTATLDFKPIPASDALIIRWDNRYEMSSEDIYTDTEGAPDSGWFASVVGVVVQGG